MGFFEILLTLLIAAALATNSIQQRLYTVVAIVVIALIFGVFIGTVLTKKGPNQTNFYE